MTQEQLTGQIMTHSKDIAALWETSKSAHRRINESDEIAKGIHKLAANMEALALQVKLLTERMDSTIERMESSLKSQGERIGKVESFGRLAETQEKSITSLAKKIEAIEREPADKWRSLVKQLITLTTAALAGGMLSNFLN